jgi:hypothetical protein
MNNAVTNRLVAKCRKVCTCCTECDPDKYDISHTDPDWMSCPEEHDNINDWCDACATAVPGFEWVDD